MKNYLHLLLAVLFVQAQAQTTISVDNSPGSGADYANVADAINAATTGDTIFIHPSATSYGNVSVTKKLHFVSLGHSPQYTQGMAAQLGNITLDAAPAGADGISFSGLRFGTLSLTNNSHSYNQVEILNCFFAGITAGTAGPGFRNNWVIAGCILESVSFNSITRTNGGGWMIMNNHLRNPSLNWSWNLFRNLDGSDTFRNNIVVTHQNPTGVNNEIRLFENCVNLNIENSIILFLGAVETIFLTGNSLNYTNCLTYSYAGSTLAPLTGTGNLNNTDPNFIDIGGNPSFNSSKNFNIQAGSPASSAGTDDQDIGLYGNSFAFNAFGYPNQFPFISLMQILNAVVSPGGTLNVKIEATGN